MLQEQAIRCHGGDAEIVTSMELCRAGAPKSHDIVFPNAGGGARTATEAVRELAPRQSTSHADQRVSCQALLVANSVCVATTPVHALESARELAYGAAERMLQRCHSLCNNAHSPDARLQAA
jgi:hypothetical protein